MKVLVLIVGFLFIGYHVDARAISGAYGTLDPGDEACVSELHLNRDKIVAMDVTKAFPENDDEIIQFVGCSGKRMGLISPTGDVVYEKIVELILQSIKNNYESQSGMMSSLKTAVSNAAENCHQYPASDVNPGLVLIKAMNCIDMEADKI